jgi:murein L,D-transpeptidase YcbB/YkuD
MADMVAEMQRSRGLKPTGRFDERTASALSGEGRTAGISPSDIIANMERWRWLPQDLGTRHISVNVPDFSLALVDGDRVIHTSRVIVGKPETPTPVFSQAMQYVIVNPYWNIPPSILRKEILPGLAQDPEYAAKRGYEVIRRNGSVSVRQPPGERNALGFIKFIFPPPVRQRPARVQPWLRARRPALPAG